MKSGHRLREDMCNAHNLLGNLIQNRWGISRNQQEKGLEPKKKIAKRQEWSNSQERVLNSQNIKICMLKWDNVFTPIRLLKIAKSEKTKGWKHAKTITLC